MKKNEVYTATVVGLGTAGEGIVKVEGETVFVPHAIAGEEVTFQVLACKGGVNYGKLLSVKTPSPDRVTPTCSAYYRCGGCQLQHLSVSAQEDFKQQLVANTLRKIGGIDLPVQPTVGEDKCYRYRNKLALPIGVDDKGNTVVGFYAERSHRIIPIDDCPIQAEWTPDLIKAVLAFAKDSGLSGYDEVSKKGTLRHIVVREVDQKFIVVLVCAKPANIKPFVAYLQHIWGDFTLWLNVNSSTGNAITGDKWELIHGEGFFESQDLGIKFKAGASTFLQVNDGVRTKLYQAVQKSAYQPNAVVLDLYSGGGMLTAMLAQNAVMAYGVEIVPEASACADELKKLNGMEDKIHNVCGKVEDKIDEIMEKTQGYARVIVCDPPRKGMERSVVQAVKASGADKVVLVSCNPATLARDLGLLLGTLVEVDGQLVKHTILVEKGLLPRDSRPSSPYELLSITPYDMFPMTKHVETLVCLERR